MLLGNWKLAPHRRSYSSTRTVKSAHGAQSKARSQHLHALACIGTGIDERRWEGRDRAVDTRCKQSCSRNKHTCTEAQRRNTSISVCRPHTHHDSHSSSLSQMRQGCKRVCVAGGAGGCKIVQGSMPECLWPLLRISPWESYWYVPAEPHIITSASSLENLQVVFQLRQGSPDVMGMISLITSWAQLGSSLGKVLLLNDLLPYHKKQVAMRDNLPRWRAASNFGYSKDNVAVADSLGALTSSLAPRARPFVRRKNLGLRALMTLSLGLCPLSQFKPIRDMNIRLLSKARSMAGKEGEGAERASRPTRHGARTIWFT